MDKMLAVSNIHYSWPTFKFGTIGPGPILEQRCNDAGERVSKELGYEVVRLRDVKVVALQRSIQSNVPVASQMYERRLTSWTSLTI